ncbi:hypothetical protein [Streptomyces sp. ICBB 8177]|uniref:hypothetical protein n=1 Tax=Streptomyces sp. ICBB 8177 TaxID=563922 RepID=UPI000D6799A9|nr:hypothetical protein [Streptomyces sp. ICBB 8177]PWI44166.1 hypothetical protein CK485_19305 [Streptomyces sp. ICBB 8177]
MGFVLFRPPLGPEVIAMGRPPWRAVFVLVPLVTPVVLACVLALSASDAELRIALGVLVAVPTGIFQHYRVYLDEDRLVVRRMVLWHVVRLSELTVVRAHPGPRSGPVVWLTDRGKNRCTIEFPRISLQHRRQLAAVLRQCLAEQDVRLEGPVKKVLGKYRLP